MRIAGYLFALIVSAPLVLPLACGGGTPEPKNEDEANSETKSDTKSAKSDDTAPADSSGAAGETPPAESAPPAASAAPAGGGDSSGDIKAPKADDPWMAAHTMPDADVNKTVKKAKVTLTACYKKGKKKDPSTSGEVKVKFIVTNDGKVTDWKDDASSMSNQDVITCVGEAIKKLKFPKQKSPGSAVGTYSINFNP
jgi:hypothetical protein